MIHPGYLAIFARREGSRSREMMDALGARKVTKRKKSPNILIHTGETACGGRLLSVVGFLFVSDAEGNKQG